VFKASSQIPSTPCEPARISFIVPAHNEQALLGRTLESIASAAAGLGLPCEMIVVDDASTDRTAEIARAHGAAVVAVRLRQIAAVRNAGAKAATSDVFVFVDADTVLPADTLRAALAELDAGAVGGGATVRFDGPVALWARCGLAMFTVGARLLRWTAGCFVFVRRQAFEAVGGFDERYYAAEELVLSMALKRQGRFVILRLPIVTSARKGTPQEMWRFGAVLLRLIFRGHGVLRRREGLGIWYERRMAIPHLDTSQSLCRAGVAQTDITPPVGIYHRMWGAARHDRSTGIHRPLTATALVLSAAPETFAHSSVGAHELALVAVDHCLLWPKEMATLLGRVSAATGVADDRLLVMFSHTHGAGLMGLERAELPGGDLIAPYLDELAVKLATLVRQAKNEMQAVTITYGTGHCSLGGHRDLWDAASGQWVCGFNPQGEADDTVLVARLADFHGRAVATVVNYACHPTTLAWDNTLISPDYVGACRELVEQVTAAPMFFIQGASGDVGPRDGFVGDVAVADANGRQLGHAALAALESLPPACTRFEYAGPVVSGAVIGTWKHQPLSSDARRDKAIWRHRRWIVDLPYRCGLPTPAEIDAELARRQAAERAARMAGDEALARACRAQVEVMRRQKVRLGSLPAGKAFPFPVHVWQLGDAIWVAVESEHYQAFARSLRRRFPQTAIVVATIVNGSISTYLPTRETYGTGIYQETIALLAPGCLEQLIEEIASQIGQWAVYPGRE